MRLVRQPLHAAVSARFTIGMFSGAVMLIAPAFCGAVALAHGPATDDVAPSHHIVTRAKTAPQPAMRDIANTDSAAPPVVVQLSTTELSRGPAQASGPVTLPMSFGQPVAPEDELTATPAPVHAPASAAHRATNHVSRRATHLAISSVPVATDDGVEVPDMREFVDPAA
jgi:hypothetical protein